LEHFSKLPDKSDTYNSPGTTPNPPVLQWQSADVFTAVIVARLLASLAATKLREGMKLEQVKKK
jgi:hypothetical protein